MSQQSFADLGVSRAVVARARRARHHTRPSPSRSSSSPTCSPAATCSPSRPPGPARRSPSACRWSTGSPPTPAARAALVLAPTRELASQIVDELRAARPRPQPLRRRRLRRRRHREADRATRQRAHILVATPGRLEDLLQRRAFTLDHVQHARARRGRPHARHGLPPGRRPHRRAVPAPSARRCSSRPRSTARPAASPRAYTRDAARHEHTPPQQRTADIEHRFLAVERDDRLDALVGELQADDRELRARLRAHQARRRPARQAPRRARASRPSRCTATSRSASARRRSPRSRPAASTRSSRPTSPPAASTSTASRTSSTSTRRPTARATSTASAAPAAPGAPASASPSSAPSTSATCEKIADQLRLKPRSSAPRSAAVESVLPIAGRAPPAVRSSTRRSQRVHPQRAYRRRRLVGRAQPSPKLVAPTTFSAPAASRPNIGPPESPWQVSTPPCGKPAHTIVCGSKSLVRAGAVGVGGDRDLRLLQRVRRCRRPRTSCRSRRSSRACPAPTGAPPAPTTFAGALVDARRELEQRDVVAGVRAGSWLHDHALHRDQLSLAGRDRADPHVDQRRRPARPACRRRRR